MIPRAIYFDTNALFQLGHGELNVDFVGLRELSKPKSDLYAPRLVVRELIQLRLREASEQVQKLEQASRRLGYLLFRNPLECEKTTDVESTISTGIEKFLDSAGIATIPTPEIQLETLIEMAITKEPPFEERREKGFRDSVILFSVIEHMRARSFSSAMLISGDQIFNEKAVTDRFNAEGIEIYVAQNIATALEYYKAQVNDEFSVFINEKSGKIKRFLGTNFKDISDYILANAQISETFLRGGIFGNNDLEGTTIKKILRVLPREVSKVYFALLSTREPVPSGFLGITFTASMDITLVVDKLRLEDLFGPKFPLAALDEFEKLRFTFNRPKQDEIVEVKRGISLEALIRESDDNYSDLQILRVLC